MGRPLTAGERAALVAGRFYGPPPSSSLARYEATVRAFEAERDALRERVERLRAALVTICETTCSWFEVEDIATRALYADDETGE